MAPRQKGSLHQCSAPLSSATDSRLEPGLLPDHLHKSGCGGVRRRDKHFFPLMYHSRWRVLRILAAHPRLFASSLLGSVVAAACLMCTALPGLMPFLIGWNAGALVYIFLAFRVMASAEQSSIRHRARIQSEGAFAVLLFSALSGIAGMGSTAAGISSVREVHGILRGFHIGLTVLTLATSWLFTHLMFAQEYAHRFYRNVERGKPGGMEFPGDDTPDYHDFFYFSIVVGTSAQTADVCFSNGPMRRLGTLHCVLAFLFNTIVLALTINIASSLF